eukprot:1188148-Prorocentrum_minimum.AAC.8
MAGTGIGSFIQYAVMPPVLLLNRLQMAITAPEKYGVVSVGCEIMQFWTTIEEDMLPIPVANHALAGSSTADVLAAADFQAIGERSTTGAKIAYLGSVSSKRDPAWRMFGS